MEVWEDELVDERLPHCVCNETLHFPDIAEYVGVCVSDLALDLEIWQQSLTDGYVMAIRIALAGVTIRILVDDAEV